MQFSSDSRGTEQTRRLIPGMTIANSKKGHRRTVGQSYKLSLESPPWFSLASERVHYSLAGAEEDEHSAHVVRSARRVCQSTFRGVYLPSALGPM